MLKFLVAVVFMFLAKNSCKAQNQPALCSDSTSMDFNATQLSGIWWEVARNPYLSGLACVRVNFTLDQTENELQIATTYSVSTTYLWVNQTMYASISLANTNNNGYNISYIDGISTTQYTVYKLLSTDYKNYALICGYTNSTNNATSFGIVLTRERYPNATQLMNIEAPASTLYADFINGTMPLITQSPTCYGSGAVSSFSMLATIFSLLYATLIFVI